MDDLLHINGEPKTGLDFKADLKSGRLHRFLALLTNQLILTQQGINKMTQNEQKIIDAASVIARATTQLSNGMAALEAKIAQLQSQAQSPEAHEVEDLSQEFTTLSEGLSTLQALGNSMETVAEDHSVSEPTPINPADPPPPGSTVGQTDPVDPAPIPEPLPELPPEEVVAGDEVEGSGGPSHPPVDNNPPVDPVEHPIPDVNPPPPVDPVEDEPTVPADNVPVEDDFS